MGLYDYFKAKCLYCGEELSIQTKLMDCTMTSYIEGMKTDISGSTNLQLKEPCHKCGGCNRRQEKGKNSNQHSGQEESVFGGKCH